jgi:hypothetical protein
MEEQIIEVYYEDGTRFLTKEEYDKLYTFDDLKNTICSIGFFLFENRNLVLKTVSISSALFSFHQPVEACQMNGIQNQSKTFVLEQGFDPDESFQSFLHRTGNGKKKQKKLKNVKKSSLDLLTLAHFLSSTTNPGVLWNGNFTVPVHRVINKIPPVLFLKNNLGGNVVNIVKKVIPTGKLLVRGGALENTDGFLLFPILVGFLNIFDVLKNGKTAYDGLKNLKDIFGDEDQKDLGTGKPRTRKQKDGKNKEGFDLWTLAENSKNPVLILIVGIGVYIFVKKNPDVLPESITNPLGISRKRTWKDFFKSCVDFRTPKPYIILASGGIVFFSYRNGSTVISFLKQKQPMTVLFDGIFSIANKQFDAYKEVMTNLFQNSSEAFKKTSETNEMFFTRTLKDLEDSKVQQAKIAEKIILLSEKNAECGNALSLSEMQNSYCAVKANEYGSQKFRLQLENDALSKVYHDFYQKVREVSHKLISHSSSSDSKALVIPGSKVNLQEYLELLTTQASKQYDEFSQNIQNQKTPNMYESLPSGGKKK